MNVLIMYVSIYKWTLLPLFSDFINLIEGNKIENLVCEWILFYSAISIIENIFN